MALTTVPASLSATALTLTTAAQPNITSVGTLTGLTVSGNIAGTLTTAAQTNITSLGTLSALTISGDLTVDTSTLKVDSSNNRVGIGVATPAAPLDVMVAGANQVYIRNSDNSAQNNAIVSLRSGGYSNIALDGATVDLKIGGSSKLHVDANGKVGIGTSSLAEKLHVYSTADTRIEVESTTGVAAFKATNNSGSYAWYVNSSADKFHLYDFTDSANRVTIDGSGTVGIATTDLHTWATFDGRLRIGARAFFGTTTGSSQMGYNWYYDGAYKYIAADFANRYYQNGGNHVWETAASGSADGTITWSGKMRIDSSGDVGIGADGIANGGGNRLAIDTAVNAAPVTSGTTQTGGALRLRGGDNAVLDFGLNSVNTWIQATDKSNLANGYNIALNPNGGNVGIGESNPDASLHITSNTPIISFDESDASKEYRIGSYGGAFAIRDETASNYRVVVTGGGNVGIGVTDPTANLEIYTASVSAHTDLLKLTMPSWGSSVNYLKNIVWEDTGNNVGAIGMYYTGSQTVMNFHSFYVNGYKSESDILMTIMGSGNVGIGEDAPDRRLHIKSGANSGNGVLRIESANNNIMDMGTDGTGHFINCVNTDPFSVQFAGTEKFRIYSDGKVDIKNSGTDKIVRFINTGSGTQGVTIGSTTSNSAGTGVHIGHQGTKAFIHPYNYGAGAYQQMEIACSDFVLKVNGSASGMTMDSSANAIFYGDVKINDANDRLLQNGVGREAKGGYINGNQTVSFTVNLTNQSVVHIRCGFNHYGLLGYGCALDQIYANGSGGITSLTALINHTTGVGGSWTVARVDNNNITINKNAGTYAGGGYYYIIVEGANL